MGHSGLERRARIANAMGLGLASGVVQLSPSDETWASTFVSERERLLSVAGKLPIAIEHVGSTAVPGLLAKPILDVLAGRPSDSDLPPYIEAIEAAGYVYRGEEGLPGREYFVRDGPDGRRTHHLHLVVRGGDLWTSQLAFRDYLRRVPDRAAAYASLKQDLAARYPNDRPAYTNGKADFIAETLRAAAADTALARSASAAKPLSFRPIDIDNDRAVCMWFRADSFVESFGSADRFFRVAGEGGRNYLEGLNARNRDWPGSCVHVLLDDEIVGQIEVRREQGNPKLAHVLLYYLRSDFRGLGLGEQLDAYVRRLCRAAGVTTTTLRVSPTNTRAIAYYRKHGWRDLGKDPEHPDVHVMERTAPS